MKTNSIKRVLFVVLCSFLVVIMSCGGKKEEGIKENSPPEIHELSLLPLNPTIESEISVRILASDIDGDPLTYRVKWFVNDKEIGEGMSLKYEEAKKGDKIFAEVTPFDGKKWGRPVKTGVITIGGIPPRIISLKVSPESLFVTTPKVEISAMVEDPDKDSIKLIVHWLVKDEVIPDSSNILDFKKYNVTKKDVITGAAYAYDGELRSEPFTFELHIANSSPILSSQTESIKASPESLYYQVPIIDPDGDKLTFELLDGPKGVKIDKNTGVIFGNAGDVDKFSVLVRAKDTDGAYLDAKFTLTAP